MSRQVLAHSCSCTCKGFFLRMVHDVYQFTSRHVLKVLVFAFLLSFLEWTHLAFCDESFFAKTTQTKDKVINWLATGKSQNQLEMTPVQSNPLRLHQPSYIADKCLIEFNQTKAEAIANEIAPFVAELRVVDHIKRAQKSVKKTLKHHIKSCKAIIGHVEEEYKIPKNLLASIAMIESKNHPWSVWAQGKGHIFKTQADAVTFINNKKRQGVNTFFVGCMQLCVQSHGHRFKSVKDTIDPHKNIRYAAKLLRRLYKKYGSWESAIMYYNASSNMEVYRDKVLRLWKRQRT